MYFKCVPSYFSHFLATNYRKMSNPNSTVNESIWNVTKTEGEEIGLGDKKSELIHLQTLMLVVPFLVPAIFSLVIIIGFVGNLLVVLAVVLNKSMRTTTNILIFNLAVSFRCKI